MDRLEDTLASSGSSLAVFLASLVNGFRPQSKIQDESKPTDNVETNSENQNRLDCNVVKSRIPSIHFEPKFIPTSIRNLTQPPQMPKALLEREKAHLLLASAMEGEKKCVSGLLNLRDLLGTVGYKTSPLDQTVGGLSWRTSCTQAPFCNCEIEEDSDPTPQETEDSIDPKMVAVLVDTLSDHVKRESDPYKKLAAQAEEFAFSDTCDELFEHYMSTTRPRMEYTQALCKEQVD